MLSPHNVDRREGSVRPGAERRPPSLARAVARFRGHPHSNSSQAQNEPRERAEVNPGTVRKRTSSKDLGTHHPPRRRLPSTIARLLKISRSWGEPAAGEVRYRPTDRMCATVVALLAAPKRLRENLAIGNRARRD